MLDRHPSKNAAQPQTGTALVGEVDTVPTDGLDQWFLKIRGVVTVLIDENQLGIAGADAVFEFNQNIVGVPAAAGGQTVGLADVGETTAGVEQIESSVKKVAD